LSNNEAKYGKNLFIYSFFLLTLLSSSFPSSYSKFTSLITNTESNKDLYGGSTPTFFSPPIPLIYILYGFSSSSIYISSSSSSLDWEYCGMKEYPCLTLNKGKARKGGNEDVVLRIEEAYSFSSVSLLNDFILFFSLP
jgi:hypothetical protein